MHYVLNKRMFCSVLLCMLYYRTRFEKWRFNFFKVLISFPTCLRLPTSHRLIIYLRNSWSSNICLITLWWYQFCIHRLYSYIQNESRNRAPVVGSRSVRLPGCFSHTRLSINSLSISTDACSGEISCVLDAYSSSSVWEALWCLCRPVWVQMSNL